MAGNPRTNTSGKGFWDGGPKGHTTNRESGGMRSGYPGVRRARLTGIRTDLERPALKRPEIEPLQADDPRNPETR